MLNVLETLHCQNEQVPGVGILLKLTNFETRLNTARGASDDYAVLTFGVDMTASMSGDIRDEGEGKEPETAQLEKSGHDCEFDV